MKKKFVLSLAIAITAAACAAPGRQSPGDRAGGASGGVDQPQLLLAHARKLQAKKGCKAAIPAYRVIASFGDGYEVAQYELGACLLTVDGANDIETALFAKEASFWLTRAAWAGSARAQLKLATALSGAPAAGDGTLSPDPADAIKWALVFEQNSARKLYNMKPVPAPIMEHLEASLNSEMLAAAQTFADDFTPITMSAFSAPRPENAGNRFQQRQQTGERRQKRRH